MCNIRKGLAVLALGVLATALPVEAQGWDQVEFSLGGGVGVPSGDFDDAFKLGWHGLAAVSYTLPNAPIAFQLDGAFSRFHDDAATVNLKDNIIYGTGNILYQIEVSDAARVLPYLIAGGGVYNIDPRDRDAAGLDSRTEFGFNLGAGVAFDAGRMRLFIESRFHDVLDGMGASDLRFYNFTAGLRFGPQ